MCLFKEQLMKAMQIINALSLTSHAHHWLAHTRAPRILHIFDRTCNLINEHWEVLSIVTPQIGNGPFNLVLGGNVCFSEHLSLPSGVSISPNNLMLGDLIIQNADAKFWNPSPHWEELHIKRDDIVNQLIKLHSNKYPSVPITDYQPLREASNLFIALAREDILTAVKITSQLAGLGIGLTPSGDDLIMGAIYAMWIIHPPTVARVLIQEIAHTAAPLTTSLSASWLRSAGRGEAGGVWHEFFDALISTDSIRIQETMKSILDIGETSGADALSGFFGTILAWAALSPDF